MKNTGFYIEWTDSASDVVPDVIERMLRATPSVKTLTRVDGDVVKVIAHDKRKPTLGCECCCCGSSISVFYFCDASKEYPNCPNCERPCCSYSLDNLANLV